MLKCDKERREKLKNLKIGTKHMSLLKKEVREGKITILN